jgi:hypothetical protein
MSAFSCCRGSRSCSRPTTVTRYRFGLAQALDALASDITWDERGNWSEAQIATVEVL